MKDLKDDIIKNYERGTRVLSALSIYFNHALKKNEEVYRYCIAERKLLDSDIEMFKIGYVPSSEKVLEMCNLNHLPLGIVRNSGLLSKFSDRIVFPIDDIEGNVIGFSGRVWREGDERTKYVNSYNCEVFVKSLSVFGLFQAKDFIKKYNFAIVVEGNLDVISLHRIGLQNTVAPCGTALTSYQLNLIKMFTKNIAGWFDSDEAGRKASIRAQKLCEMLGVKYYNIGFEDAKDPDECVNMYEPKYIKLMLRQALQK